MAPPGYHCIPHESPFAGKFLGAVNSISSKYEVWEHELKNDLDSIFLLEGIRNGFRISNVESPDQVHCVEHRNHPSAIQFSGLVEKDLRLQLALNHYVCASEPPLVISPIGAIPKEGGDDVRIIHDGSRPVGDAMNDYSVLHSVHYQTLEDAYSLAKPNYYLAKVDLKSAYRSVAIHPLDYCLTGLKWHFDSDTDPTFLFDTRLPFGASQAPSIFHRLTQSVRRMMARLGFENLVVYLDDFLCIEETYERCLLAQQTLISLLIKLGFCISWHKVLGPSRVLPFLGIIINTSNCSLSQEENKLTKLESKLMSFHSKTRATKRQLQSLAGSLNWACQAVRGGRYFLRRILDSINRLKHGSHKCKLTKAFKLDIEWWLMYLRSFNGVVFYRQCASYVVHTDACDQGAGMFCGGDWQYVNWRQDRPEFRNLHINYKEVISVILAAKKWAQVWKNAQVTVVTDSTVAKAIINKGTCRSPIVMNLLRELFWLSEQHQFKLRAMHIPGKLNQLPDCISRLHEDGQVLHLQSLLQFWHHQKLDNVHVAWTNHMSPYALQVIQPQLDRWRSRLS